MLYFDCFMVGAWAFAFGWLFGAVYTQNQAEETETSRVNEIPVPRPECDAWRLPVLAASEMSAD